MSEIKVNSIKGVAASVAALTINNTDGTCTANVTNNLSNRRINMNGAQEVCQRGTSFSSYSSGDQYVADRYNFAISGAGTWTVSKSTTSPDGFANSIKADCTTANTSLSAGHYLIYITKFEGQDLQLLQKGTSNAKKLTLSFHVRSNKTGTYIAEFIDYDNSRSISKSYTISSADTWEKKTITIDGDTTGAFDNDNAKSFAIFWWLAAGSTYNSASLQTSWGTNTTNARATGQVNLADSTSNEWYITGIQVEASDHATDFEHKSYAQELLLCQRYYRVLTDGSEDGTSYIGLMSYNYDVNSVVTQINFIPEMRATPTADSTSGTNYYRFYRNSGYVDINSLSTLNGMTRKGGAFNNADSGNGTAGQSGGIVTNNASAKIAFSAEL